MGITAEVYPDGQNAWKFVVKRHFSDGGPSEYVMYERGFRSERAAVDALNAALDAGNGEGGNG